MRLSFTEVEDKDIFDFWDGFFLEVAQVLWNKYRDYLGKQNCYDRFLILNNQITNIQINDSPGPSPVVVQSFQVRLTIIIEFIKREKREQYSDQNSKGSHKKYAH